MKYSLFYDCYTHFIATVRADGASQYHFYAWTKIILGDKVEIKGSLNHI